MSGHSHLYQRSIMSNNAAYQDIRFYNEAKWHTRFHNRHKWNVSTAYLRHVQAQPAQHNRLNLTYTILIPQVQIPGDVSVPVG